MSAAFVGGLIAHRLRLPTLIGYLLAGVVLGPFTPGFVADTHLAPQLAEIGVILLMFGVGNHFSIGDLLAVRRIALPGTIGQVAVAAEGNNLILAGSLVSITLNPLLFAVVKPLRDRMTQAGGVSYCAGAGNPAGVGAGDSCSTRR